MYWPHPGILLSGSILLQRLWVKGKSRTCADLTSVFIHTLEASSVSLTLCWRCKSVGGCTGSWSRSTSWPFHHCHWWPVGLSYWTSHMWWPERDGRRVFNRLAVNQSANKLLMLLHPPTLPWCASSLTKEHLRRSPAMSAKVCGRFWLLSRSWAASVRTSCWAAHWRCCEERREDRQQAARALASSRGPTAEGLWEGWAYKCAIRPAREMEDKVTKLAGEWLERAQMKETNMNKNNMTFVGTDKTMLLHVWIMTEWRLRKTALMNYFYMKSQIHTHCNWDDWDPGH